MYHPFFEIIVKPPINIPSKMEYSATEVLSCLAECLPTLKAHHIADLMESYFVDLNFGTNFGLYLCRLLLKAKSNDQLSLGFIITYLSYYPESDDVCSEARKQLQEGQIESVKLILSKEVSSLIKANELNGSG